MDIVAIVTQYTETIVTISAIVSTALGTIMYQWKQNVKTNETLKEIKESKDSGQDEEIKQLREEINELKKIIERISSHLSEVSKALFTHNEAEKKHDFIGQMKREIMNSVHFILSNTKNLDKAFEGMAVEGAILAYEWFKNMYYGGYKGLNAANAKREAYAKLRQIRSQNVGMSNIPSEISENIKNEIAEPIIDDFLAKMEMLATGVYNGDSDRRFKELCLDFIRQFIIQGWAVYAKFKKG